MDNQRRRTIKMLLAGIGVAATNQTLLNIAHAAAANISSTKSANSQQIPKHFTQPQYQFICQIADVILPATQTPSATALALPHFVSQMVEQTLNAEQKTVFLEGLALIMAEVTTEHFQKHVVRYFSLTAVEQSEKQALIQLAHKNVTVHQKPDYYRYRFLLTLRTFLLIGFISHETIATALQDPRDFPQPYQPGDC